MARRQTTIKESLDYNEGLSLNQVYIVLREFGLDHRLDEFKKWLAHQSFSLVPRYDQDGPGIVHYAGISEKVLFRWIQEDAKTELRRKFSRSGMKRKTT